MTGPEHYRKAEHAARATVLREAAAALREARRMGHLFLVSEEEFLEQMADEAGEVTPAGGEITRAAHAYGEPHANSETAFRQLAVASWPLCSTLIIDGQPPLIGACGGAGMRRAPSGDALIVELQMWFTDAPAAGEAGKVTPTGAEVAQPADFFQPGRTYAHGQTGYRAPEMTTLFRVEHVTRHPDRGHLRAIGWSRAGEPGSLWHGDFRDEGEFNGWTEVTEGGDTRA
ncbi:hypothetical protein [Streptomyces milbemycinicus]|uniref:hypothetical protein n=1 Tax=Streptomyces milbemycinicus TaxID=476552 RepID=UPI000A3AF8CE|nr:hypothetical protein [Streptomyces milbemycinicus]